ncbi:MAG: anthranilate phosphoribosyltransferase [Chloroflexi bacterium]|nr:anthranilate phosphoribosyltransferase [Chloroflexota bacterium]
MIKEAIGKLVDDLDLTEAEAGQVMTEIMTGAATPAQLAAFLVALRVKGETTHEILGLVRVMREKSLRVDVSGPLLDTCGTGGDASGTFNISTAAAIIAAAAGIRVAKHGNRSATSKCGSADVLEALGVRIRVTPEQAKQSIERIGIAFLFAQAFHPSMKYAGPTRAEIGIRTVFNILGPLANPARATRQVVGVAHPDLAPKMANALPGLGVEHALVVHGEDGLDEITLSGATTIHEVRGGQVTFTSVTPKELGLAKAAKADLAGGDKEQNAHIIRSLFKGEKGPKRDALLANAGAALYVGGKAASIKAGVAAAATVIDSGGAARKLDEWIAFSKALPS